MFSRKGKRFMALFLTASALLGFGGCRGANHPDPEPIDGGSTVYTDPNAPKEIKSKELTEFDASFTIFTRYKAGGKEDNTFRFLVSSASGTDGKGSLTATETVSGLSCPADGDLLDALRDVVTKYNLAARNGLYDVTAGLPPEFGPGGLTARYASGETLTFTTDNDPYALWAEEVYDVFADWFARQGVEGLFPAEETAPLETFGIFFEENGKQAEYGVEEAEDGGLLLFREVGGARESVPLPAGLMTDLSRFAASAGLGRKFDFSVYNHEMNNFGNHDLGFFGLGSAVPDYSEADADGLSLLLDLTYETGRRIRIHTRKASEIEAVRPVLEKMISVCDEAFR